jgi:hypothetical protein
VSLVASVDDSIGLHTSCSHRLYHVPQITDGKVEHYADSYDECLDLAKNNATFATLNTHSLQYFANHVYAYVLRILSQFGADFRILQNRSRTGR